MNSQAKQLSKQLVDRFKEIIKEQEVRPKTLSENMGKSRSFIAMTLQPHRNFTLSTLCALADKLGYKVKISIEKQ